MPASAILGAQWGDEGKGKLVDVFSEGANLVVRFQGGPNAGHTIKVKRGEGELKLVLHHVPSGLLHPNVKAVMGEGMVVDPIALLGEMEQLRAAGVEVSPERLKISLDAQVILPLHRALDRAREANRKGGGIGTTLRGMGPVYEDRAARRGIRFRDLMNTRALEPKLDRLLLERNALLKAYGAEEADRSEHLRLLSEWADTLQPFLTETHSLVLEAVNGDSKVLFEGAQGAMLDIGFGTYPFVTSSHTISGGITIGAGLPPQSLGRILGVTKAYTTRVGAGPFPSELFDDSGRHLAEKGNEFGATTGRPRRCGWLDLVALKYAHQLCGFTSLVLTKLDVLSGLPSVALCTAYGTASGETSQFPRDVGLLENVTPVMEQFDGWEEDICGCQSFDELPSSARSLVNRVEEYIGVPVSVVSVGARRDQSIVRGNPLW